ncbi:Organic cation transporter protein [Lamellibrachia satsuma]|nr:Organic cation transporter protein [Lamellibrachia satsuma]
MLFDDILKEIGECGPYQILLYILLGLAGIPTGFQNMSITFLGADMDHWCHVPQLANLSGDQQRYISIPSDEVGRQTYSQCYMYDIDYSGFDSKDFLGWNRSKHIGTNTPRKKCTSWQYDQSLFLSSYVSTMDLVCDRAPLLSLMQTIYMTGCLSGCIGFGQLSDRIGRRKTLLITLASEVMFATAATVSSNYILCALYRFLVGAAAAGVFTTVFVYGMEIIGPKFRDATGIMVQAWFAVGLMILPGAAYFIRDHVHLQWMMAMTPVIMILYAFFIPETARWLISQGRDEEAMQVLKTMSRFNKRKLPFPLNLEENRVQVRMYDSVSHPSFADLFRSPNLRKTTLYMWWAWFVVCMVYYGLGLGVNLLGGNIFLNSFMSGAIEIPSYIIVIPIMNKLGRRWTSVISLGVASFACFVCTILLDKEGLHTALVVFSMWGKFSISATFAVIYVYSAELFPTVVRQVGIGSSSMCARVGGLVQPQFGRLLTEAVISLNSGPVHIGDTKILASSYASYFIFRVHIVEGALRPNNTKIELFQVSGECNIPSGLSTSTVSQIDVKQIFRIDVL